jgi:NAD(P)-dependent dehydrogenase (short-subunit alcohol dehydrogenase family)
LIAWWVLISERHIFLAQEFLRQISYAAVPPRDPTIINIASVNALVGNANLVAYAGTKGALTAMTRAMAVEMKEFSVRVKQHKSSGSRNIRDEEPDRRWHN